MDIQTRFKTLCEGNIDEKIDIIDELRTLDLLSIAHCLLDIIEEEKSTVLKEKIILLVKQLAFPKTNLQIIERMFKSDDPFIRNSTIEFLRQADTDFLSTMARLADDDDKDVRKFVLDTLVEHSSKEALMIVEGCLSDPADVVRQAAIEYLGNLGVKNAAETIEKQLRIEKNLMIKCTCLEALSSIGFSPGSNSIIDDFTKDNNPFLQFSFVRYLGTFGNANDINYIEELIKYKGAIGITQLIVAAGKISQRDKDAKFSDFLINAAKSAIEKEKNENSLWEMSRSLLYGMVAEDAINEAKIMLDHDSESVREAAEEFLDNRNISY